MCARFTVLGDTPIAAAINGCVIKLSRATSSGCADAALGVFSIAALFSTADLVLGAFDHLFPPNQMIRGNHTLRPEDKSLRCPLHGTASASIQISYGSGISLHVSRHWIAVDQPAPPARGMAEAHEIIVNVGSMTVQRQHL